MMKPSLAGPVALGAAAGLAAAMTGDVAVFAAAGFVGLSVIGIGRG